jgi:hypothetical protein
MSDILKIKERQDSSISLFKEIEECVFSSDEMATMFRLLENVVYNPTIEGEAASLRVQSNSANYSNREFMLNVFFNNNYSYIKIDKRGLSILQQYNMVNASKIDKIDYQPSQGRLSSTWTDNFIELEKTSKVEIGLSSIAPRLRKFASLKTGWDFDKAEAIGWETITAAIDFFAKVLYDLNKNEKKSPIVPFVAPLPDGGILFEWKTCYKELNVVIPAHPNIEMEYLMVEKTVFGEEQEDKVTFIVNDVIEVITNWLH